MSLYVDAVSILDFWRLEKDVGLCPVVVVVVVVFCLTLLRHVPFQVRSVRERVSVPFDGFKRGHHSSLSTHWRRTKVAEWLAIGLAAYIHCGV